MAKQQKTSDQSDSQDTRLTIGLFLYSLDFSWTELLWLGVADACQEHDVNLICYPGWHLHDPDRLVETQANVVYELVNTGKLDGLIVWNGSLDTYIGERAFQNFLKRYGPMPKVCGEKAMKGIPSIIMNDYRGAHEAMTHLIETHGCRRIVCIRGPEGHSGMQERYRAYTETLAEFDIPLDPELVTPGQDWTDETLGALLDERNITFDAMIAGSDVYALAAMTALQARGLRVPEDVLVVGFDDSDSSKVAIPPLTTVRPPFYGMGRTLVETLLAMINGESVPDQMVMSPSLVVRQSCGCLSARVLHASAQTDKPVEVAAVKSDLSTIMMTQQAIMLTSMRGAAIGLNNGLGADWAEQLLGGFTADMESMSAVAFLAALDAVLRQVTTSAGNIAVLQDVVSALRGILLPYLDGKTLQHAEALWHQARVAIGEAVRRIQLTARLEAKSRNTRLQEIGSSLITMFDVGELVQMLATELPKLAIPGAYLALYENPDAFNSGEEAQSAAQRYSPPEWARLLLAYTEADRTDLPPDGLRFASRQLVPDDMWPARRFSFVVKPLYFRDSPIGFTLFDMGPRDGLFYEALRSQISSALQGAFILEARKQAETALEIAYAEIEQQVRERTAELEHEVEERERAQQHSLRLQQEIIETQKQVLREISTPIIPIMDQVLVMPLIGSIDTARARDIMRTLLSGINDYHARTIILDITGVPVVDSGVAEHLNKTIQAASLKGVHTIITGISDAVAETIVDLGIDWSHIDTLRDLQSGLIAALDKIGVRLQRRRH